MNDVLVTLGLESWKPWLTVLLLPPVPLLLGVLVGARLILPRRGLGWLLVIVSVVLLWLTACTGAANVLARLMLEPPVALGFERVRALRTDVNNKQPVAIVILGGGVEKFAPEYGVSNLSPRTLERLRYGIWLSKQTGAPMAFSGGIGWAQDDALPEARVAARVASEEFGRPIRWLELSSRDTRENASHTIALLREAGIRHIVLVTHGWHMPRARRAFVEAAGEDLRIESAPMGLARPGERAALDWFPSSEGFHAVRSVLREAAGRLAGA